MTIEQTLVIFKPDSLERRLVGNILNRFERRGFSISAMKMLQLNQEIAKSLYVSHIDKDFFPELLNFMISQPIIAVVLSGDNVVINVREMLGDTNPLTSLPNTIRGDYRSANRPVRENLIHASDSVESASREIPIFFNNLEIF